VIIPFGKKEGYKWFDQDMAAATENLLLPAANLGLGATWCGLTDDREASVHSVPVFQMPCSDLLSSQSTFPLKGSLHGRNTTRAESTGKPASPDSSFAQWEPLANDPANYVQRTWPFHCRTEP